MMVSGNSLLTGVTKPGNAAELFSPVGACNSLATATRFVLAALEVLQMDHSAPARVLRNTR